MLSKVVLVIFILLAAFFGVLFANYNYSSEVISIRDEAFEATLTINITAHRVSSGQLQSVRTHADIERVMEAAEKIWEQAEIRLNYEIVDTEFDESTEAAVYSENYRAVYSENYYRDGAINIFFVNALPANGIAIDPSAAFVNDRTSVNDFRATAHEIGHLLGLQHTTASQTRLLYRGVNGTLLTPAEIDLARANAETFK